MEIPIRRCVARTTDLRFRRFDEPFTLKDKLYIMKCGSDVVLRESNLA